MTVSLAMIVRKGFNWIIFYTDALYHLGETREALRRTKRALELCPDDARHRENFLLFAGAGAPEGGGAGTTVGQRAEDFFDEQETE